MKQVMILAPGGGTYRAHLEALSGQVRLLVADTPAEAVGRGAQTSVLITFPAFVTPDLLAAMPRLEWIQLLTSGVDGIAHVALPPEVRLSGARGCHTPQLCELVFLQMLWFMRDAPAMVERQRARRWQPAPQRLLHGRQVLIVGIGSVGEALAVRCSAFGMRVTGASAHRSAGPNFARIVPLGALADHVGDADFVIVLTPLREDTRHLIDERVLATMAPGAILINVARGAVVDQTALTAALLTGQIGGAALDVFEAEPLDPESPLWSLPNVLITPHIGGLSDIYPEQVAALLIDNIRRWRQGKPLINEVRRSAG